MIDYARISKLLRDVAFTWRAWDLWCVGLKSDLFRGIRLSEQFLYKLLRVWVYREINSRFCSKTQWQMFLLVSDRHSVSIQISINLGKTFLLISSIRKFAVTWILARIFAYPPSFYFQILDLIYWTVLIFYFDLFWIAWHWKPAIGDCEQSNILKAGYDIFIIPQFP